MLIEVSYSTINPYDRIMYSKNKTEGFVMGSDGCGFVIEVGEGVDEAAYKGKLVAFNAGAWSRYAVKDASSLAVFDKPDFDPVKAANTYVNPFTTCGLLDFAKVKGASAVVILAASSQLAKQLIKLCEIQGVQTVNIVRKDEAVKELKE